MHRSAPALALFSILSLFAAPRHGIPQAADSGPFADLQVNASADPCVRLRSGPAPDRRIIDCLEPGTRLRELGNISGWSQVRLLDGTEGWVAARFLEAAPELPAATPLPRPSAATPLPRPPAAAPSPQPEQPPAALAEPADSLQGQIEALTGQLQALSARRAATEERLRQTVEAAEAAQTEASGLRTRVRQLENEAGNRSAGQHQAELETMRGRMAELEEALAEAREQVVRAAGLNAEQERRIEELDASLAQGRAREAQRQQALTAAERRVEAAEQVTASQTERIRQLEADRPAARSREAELRQALEASENRLRAATETGARQSDRIAQLESRIAQLEAQLPATEERAAELSRALDAAQARLGEAERRDAEQRRQIESLTGEVADAQVRVAEAELKSRLASRSEAKAEPPTTPPPAGRIQVREPIVAAPEPPRISVSEPQAVPEEQPATPSARAPQELGPDTSGAINAVHAWAAAWSDQRVDDYLSFYAPGFQPPDGLTRAEWEAQRRRRLSAPRYIRVTISDMSAEAGDAGTVTARFRQEYESDTFADSVTKLLTLTQVNGNWVLLAERSTP